MTTRDILSPAELAELQGAVLRAALTGAPLPGGTTLSMPDRALLERRLPVLLLDEHLAPGAADTVGADRVRVVAPGELGAAAQGGEDVAVLRFRPPAADGGVLWLTLEAQLAPARPGMSPLGLGGVQVGFRRSGGAWRTADEPPRAFAV